MQIAAEHFDNFEKPSIDRIEFNIPINRVTFPLPGKLQLISQRRDLFFRRQHRPSAKLRTKLGLAHFLDFGFAGRTAFQNSVDRIVAGRLHHDRPSAASRSRSA